MDDPSDPADTAFQRLLNREILLSERRRMLILAGVQALILALILLTATFAPGFVRSIYHDRLPERAALAAFSAFIVYELFAASVVTIFLRRGRNFPVLGRYTNALVETSFPTVLLYLLAGYLSAPAIIFGTWPALLYFLFIILSTLRLNFAQSPRSSCSCSLLSRCISTGRPRTRTSASAITLRAAPSFSQGASWPGMPERRSKAISDARSPRRRLATK